MMIKKGVLENEIEMDRICRFFHSTEKEIEKMYNSSDLSADILLRWSKLLEYDFFRIYSQHLILYAPASSRNLLQNSAGTKKKSLLPKFRKNVYTKEIIEFILDKVTTEKMTKSQVISQYKIPKTTLYKWLLKYGRDTNTDNEANLK